MPEILAADLLDPKNDYVFFRVFSEEPALLVDLINVVRRDEPAIVEVSLLNPRLTPERLSGKSLVLDLRAVDERGQRYAIEMQVRRFTHWSGCGLLYLARLLSEQLDAGTAYRRLKPVIGIHLLDFTLFEAPEQAKQALWCFEMRDRARPEVRLGRELQLNIIELRKADRLGQLPARLSAWIADFAHWQEESTMSTHPYPPVQWAIEKLRELSADEEARYWAESRAKALSDEASLLAEAREEGREEGEQIGLQKGREDTARNLIALGVLTVGQIAQATGLSLAQ
ncbi:Rpn family recombination-promoting nuclease/putative transposase, partial [Thiorhodococcus minor]